MEQQRFHPLTGHACEELSCETLYMRARKRYKKVLFEEIEDALAEKICDNTDVVHVVEAIPQVNTLVPVVLVVLREGYQHSQFDS